MIQRFSSAVIPPLVAISPQAQPPALHFGADTFSLCKPRFPHVSDFPLVKGPLSKTIPCQGILDSGSKRLSLSLSLTPKQVQTLKQETAKGLHFELTTTDSERILFNSVRFKTNRDDKLADAEDGLLTVAEKSSLIEIIPSQGGLKKYLKDKPFGISLRPYYLREEDHAYIV